MNALSSFILRQIEKQAAISTKNGKEKYKAYFINTQLYAQHRSDADSALTEMGLGKVIVK